ncbi:alpha/beta fold hydrolase [Pseudochryseolinea flava]|uniref:alpha/beta fold hydrolase n=1 Tax=Pseudochryseolinea flava TaxID=2059302 RepID=UPI001C88BCB8|nr:alpha/beta hydrolase [Pseudochryseolinea flava]
MSAFLSKEGTKMQYIAGISDELMTRIGPELWTLDWERMSRPGNIEMQFELNCDYKNNLAMYSSFQNYFRTQQPKALIIWGKHDAFFSVKEAPCYKRDLPDAELHILDGGHKALATNFDEVLALVSGFMTRIVLRSHVE